MKINNFFDNLLYDFLKLNHEFQKQSHELKSITIEITGKCNIKCDHCYMNSGLNNKDLTTQDWKEIIKKIRKDFGKKITISITGGEPLIRKDIYEILSFLKQNKFKVTLATNGTLINKKNIPLLKKYLEVISISLDGDEKSHNYLRNADIYQKTLAGIYLVGENKIPFIIKTAVYKKNLEKMRLLEKKMLEIKPKEWHLFCVEPVGRGKYFKDILNYEEYLKLCDFIDNFNKNKNGIKMTFGEFRDLFGVPAREIGCYRFCFMGINSFSILHDGKIVSCIQNRNNLQGDAKFDNLKNVWENGFKINRDKEYQYCKKHLF